MPFIEDYLDANPGAMAQAALGCADDAPGAGHIAVPGHWR